MFMVYRAEGRNFIGDSGARPFTGRVAALDPAETTSFSSEMENLDAEASGSKHQRNLRALREYQKQLDTVADRQVVVKVGEIMTSPVISLPSTASLSEVWELMLGRGVQHLPVVDDDLLVGICSIGALLRQVIVSDKDRIITTTSKTLKDIANSEVVTTTADTDIRRVAFIMNQYKIGSLPIMDIDGRMIGIITRSDLIKRLAQVPPLEIYA